MKKLDITIGAVDCLVVMRIHYMDERFRVNDDAIIFTASNEFEVCSDARPTLYTDSICLWGRDNTKDCILSTRR